MKYIMLLLVILLSANGRAQTPINIRYFVPPIVPKPSLNIEHLKDWEEVTFLQINDNGKYCGYVIKQKQPLSDILILVGTGGKWEIKSSIKGSYSLSSKTAKAAWINSHDSLCIVSLGRFDTHYVPGVLSFWINDDYLTYQPKYPVNAETVVINLNKNLSLEYAPGKGTVAICGKKTKIILQRDGDKNKLFLKSNRAERKIWDGEIIRNIIKDNKKEQIAFITSNVSDTICYYKLGMDSVTYLNVPPDSTYIFGGLSYFSKNGEYLFLNLVERVPTLPRDKSILNVWSYTDSKLQPQQVLEQSARQYTGVIRLSDHHFFRLDSGNDWLFLPNIQDSVALIRQQEVTTPADEIDWNIHSQFSWYIVSMKNERIIKLESLKKNRIVQLSPSGKYVVYYDANEGDYFVYETQNGHRRCLTKGINENWLKESDDASYGQYIAAWGEDDTFVLLNGIRDIWQIDPKGLISPVNLTRGYGSIHNVVFFLALDEYTHRPILKHESLLLSAFNLDTKENGFYRTVTGKKRGLDSLSMGSYVYDI
ncbi:hypothetical protein, partial [Chitinophaga sp.]|uniref:hypothetical protein n=1 Tax=Chitinophaga sp. TaxID=1869181 RepID=UPI002F9324F9